MISLIIHGAAGRMGGRLVRLISESSKFRLLGAIEQPEFAKFGMDVASYHGLHPIEVPISENLVMSLKPGVVVLDFSTPEATVKAATLCAERGDVCFLSGTTGLSDTQWEALRRASDRIPVLHSPNMSVGINAMFMILPILRNLRQEFEVEIIETHHRHKADAPSGTAYKLATLLDADPDDLAFGRVGKNLTRPATQIGIHSLRLGEIIGEHTIRFCSPEEEMIIEHRALSRDTFAKGALTAAGWLVKAKPGLYSFQDVLNGGIIADPT